MSDLPEGWAWATLGEVGEVVGGATPSTDDASYWGDEVAWVTPDDLAKHSDKYIDRGRRGLTTRGLASCAASLMPAGAVLFSSRAPIGYVAVTTAPVATNQGFKSIVPGPAVSSDYLYWALQHLTPVIRRMGSGTTFTEVSKRVVVAVPLPLPPLAEQRRIVEAIETAMSVLDAGVAYLLAARDRIAALRRSAVARAVHGSLLQGRTEIDWPIKMVRELCVSLDYGTSAKSRRHEQPSDVPVLRMGNIQDGRVDTSDLKFLPGDHPDVTRKRLQPGDVLFNRTNSSELVGKTAVFTGDPEVAAFASYLIRVKVSDDVLPSWLALCINSPLGRQYIEEVRTQQVGQANVNGTKLKAMSIPLPSIDDQRAILDAVDRFAAMALHLDHDIERERDRASSLRRSILSTAFSGQLVSQDPNDEPASAILERIAAERAATEPSAQRGTVRTKVPA